MNQAINNQTIIVELKAIRKDIDFIKRNMVNEDSILTMNEHKELDEAIKEYKDGKAISFDEFSKTL